MLRVSINAFISDCARAFQYYLLMHIQLFEKLSMYRHIVTIWPWSNEVVVLRVQYRVMVLCQLKISSF